jgi:hypothetical protein
LKSPSAAQRKESSAGERLDGERVSKRSRASSRLRGDPEVALLPPRLQRLSAEQRAEAVAVLSDLLLAAACLTADSHDLAAADGELRKEGLVVVSVFGSVCAGVLGGAFGVARNSAATGTTPRCMRVCALAAIPTKKGHSIV